MQDGTGIASVAHAIQLAVAPFCFRAWLRFSLSLPIAWHGLSTAAGHFTSSRRVHQNNRLLFRMSCELFRAASP